MTAQSTHRETLIACVVEAWWLTGALRVAVEALLRLEREPTRESLYCCRALIAEAMEDGANRPRRRSDVMAIEVSRAFDLDIRCRAALLELRWAGLSGSAEERRSHLQHALLRLSDRAIPAGNAEPKEASA